ncbi:MAG: glycoside hydrolase family 2 TIM barrel-domain containing protein, partial [Bacteroidota bacterium]
IDRIDDISFGSGYAKHQIGGILRDVELVALPEQNFRQLYFETDLDENYQNAELKVFYELNQATDTELEIEVYNVEKELVAHIEKEIVDVKGELVLEVDNPLKWDAEHPNLYSVVTTLKQNNKALLVLPKKIGFREVVVEGNRLLVNGHQVKLRGACRHDIHPLLGRMTTPEFDKMDVLLAKEANMNFIRTSHYPPSEAFLSYCDQYGIYVEDETAVCFVGSHRTFEYKASGASHNDPDYRGWYLSQLQEMVQSHRNHPSVIIWSIGNENVFGTNFVESFKWIKENDTTRPVIYSYPGQVPDSLKIYEILSMHYPDWKGNLNQYGIPTEAFSYESMPVLFDEWAHVACYNNPTLQYDPNVRSFWGESLDSMWTNLFEADGGLGGAIWCMLDETFMLPDTLSGFNEWWGKLDPHVIPSTYMGKCVGYGEWGIIDTWRRKKPEFWGTKKAYSPTKILVKQVDGMNAGQELVLPVHNRFDHTNFNELKITWQYADNTGELDHVHLEPHQKGNLVIPGMDWTAGEKLNICFIQNDTMLVDEYNIQLGTRKVDLPVCQKGELMVEERGALVWVQGKGFSLRLNKKSGLLENIVVENDTLIKSGPYINLKIPGKRVQYSTIVMDDMAKNWLCESFDYEVKDGILNLYTSGRYDNLSTDFYIQVDENGTIVTEYKVEDAPEGNGIQEQGLLFYTGAQFQTLAWDRDAYFTAYPETDMGKPQGEIALGDKPEMKYRNHPEHEWSLDSRNFYYHGLEKKLPFTNIVRSLKENIYSFSLKAEGNSQLQVIDKGTKACRFDKIDGKYVLLINDQWDYTSLLWGNYMKMIKSKEKFQGVVVLGISSS